MPWSLWVGGCLISSSTGENIWQAGPGDHKELVRGDSPDVLGYLWAGQGPGRGAGTGPASHSSGLACPQLTPSSGGSRVSCLKNSLSLEWKLSTVITNSFDKG